MGHSVTERYRPEPMGVNASVVIGQSGVHSIGGFLAATTGTITVTANLAIGASSPTSTTFVNAVPVTAGIYTPIPIWLQGPITVALAAGASGTLMV